MLMARELFFFVVTAYKQWQLVNLNLIQGLSLRRVDAESSSALQVLIKIEHLH